MSRLYENCVEPGAHEHAVISACFDLHMYMRHDKDVRAALRNPKSIHELERAYEQLGSIIRKLKFAPVIDGVSRQVERAS